MNGQWIGEYTGTNNGLIIFNVDDRNDHYQGIAYLLDSNKHLPHIAAYFTTKSKDNPFEFQTQSIAPIHPTTGTVDTWDNVKMFYPDKTIPDSAYVQGSWDHDKLTVNWTTSIGTAGSGVLPKSRADQPSEYSPIIKDWNSYKEYVAALEGRRFLFRGQSGPWRLRTAFHKTGRADLVRFIAEDIPTLHKHLSARTRHIFNLSIPDENGAFFNLVQHHGYPTPLLDWSFSPYVAAFFAYRGITNAEASQADEEQKVRVFVFDQAQWQKDFRQVQQLLTADLHVSVSEFIAIDNERMLPQQAASTVTNVDDIEGYIRSKETETTQYLQVIDLPLKERGKVMGELSYMGITAASLFPGLDGACEELRERFFDI